MKRVLTALTALALTLTLGGCSRRDELVIYSGRTQELIRPLLDRFAEETGIPIAVQYGLTSDLAQKLVEEGSNSPADVFLSQAPGATGYLFTQGLLAPLSAEELNAVPARFRGPGGEWIGISGRLRVLVYNQDVIAASRLPLPKSVFDLTEPQYAGRVGVSPINASFQDFITAMRQSVGDERARAWLEGMTANRSPTFTNNNAIVEAVSRGEIPMGLVNHYYNLQFLDENPNLPSRNYYFPDGDLGTMLLETTVSVLETSDRPDDAARFVKFLLSEEAQTFLAEETFEYPLVTGVQPLGNLPSLDTIELPNIDLAKLGDGYRQTTQMISDSGIDLG
ncbi:MAG: iron ABC transporter substrate-binding protein [Egibacteraceae bacterium]